VNRPSRAPAFAFHLDVSSHARYVTQLRVPSPNDEYNVHEKKTIKMGKATEDNQIILHCASNLHRNCTRTTDRQR